MKIDHADIPKHLLCAYIFFKYTVTIVFTRCNEVINIAISVSSGTKLAFGCGYSSDDNIRPDRQMRVHRSN